MNTHPRQVLKNCMRCGSNTVSYRSDDSLFCEKCGFSFYINSAAAVAILIVNGQGELLLTKRAFDPGKGKLDLPGGFVDIGESAEQAVVRELREELNIEGTNLEYFGSYPNEYVFSGLSIYTLDMAFVCNVDSFEAIKAKDDVAAFDFFKFDRIDFGEIAFDSIRNIIKDFIEKSHF